MTCGVPQGSVLEPLHWNIALDNILPENVSIICCTEDIPVVTAVDDIPMLERRVNINLEARTHWIESAGLNLAATKIEVVLFTRRCWFIFFFFCLKGRR